MFVKIFVWPLVFLQCFVMPPSKYGRHIALLLSVGWMVHQQFPFFFFAENTHTEIWYWVWFLLPLSNFWELCPLDKRKLQLFPVSIGQFRSSLILGTIMHFCLINMPRTLKNFNYFQFLFIFFAGVSIIWS